MNDIKRAIILICVAMGIIANGANARAFTTNLFPVADTSLRNNAPDMPMGDSNPLIVGVSKTPFTVTNHALLKFDFSGIPTNATITGVTLATTIFRSNTDPANYDLNRMLVDWNEYEATWNKRNASTPWLLSGCQPGTEFVNSPSVTAEVDQGNFSSPGMVADVQLWLNNPGTNFGWIMLATEEAIGTGKQLGSRESDLPPVLTVDYIIGSPAAPPAIFGMSATENEFRFSFNAQSNHSYSIEFRDALATGNWNVLTNIPPQPADAVINITNPISSAPRFFRAKTP